MSTTSADLPAFAGRHIGPRDEDIATMLSVVGHPAAVNPDRRLSQLANAYHWPIIHLSRAA